MLTIFKKFLRIIGPYPYNPILIFLFYSACYFSRFIPVIIEQPRGTARYETALVVLLLATIPSFLFALTAKVLQNFRRWSDQSLIFYLLEVSVGQSILFICAPLIRRFLQIRYDFAYVAPLTLTPGFFVGSLILALIALALMNRAERVIANRLLYADQLVENLKADRAELIRIDEDIRQQTSRFLHDRVQSDLMVVAMKLKAVEGKSSQEVNEVVKGAISRLEATRSTDLKNLVQILAPNFDVGGIQQALGILLKQYRSSMDFKIEISEDVEELDRKVLLAIFRIIEQALLNSLIHGPAKNVEIKAGLDTKGAVKLFISDDGPGSESSTQKLGTGTTIIDSWVSILKGKKEVDTQPGHGYQLAISFPVKS